MTKYGKIWMRGARGDIMDYRLEGKNNIIEREDGIRCITEGAVEVDFSASLFVNQLHLLPWFPNKDNFDYLFFFIFSKILEKERESVVSDTAQIQIFLQDR